ncbi:MAG: SprT family zinc-dependent metalloprotease [Candidatus Syntrophopropionicum ammoniitolerans]
MAGRQVAYSLKTSTRAKNLRLQVSLEKGLVIIVPEGFDSGTMNIYLQEKQDWILAKLDHYARLKGDLAASKRFGWHVFYQGKEHRVEVRKVGPTVADTIEVTAGRVIITLGEGREKDPAAVLEHWMRSRARVLINQRIEAINEVLKLPFNRVTIKGQKTRWGSCSSLGNLNFNWRLIMAPLPVLDYIVIHELLHLIEPNHSKKFWAWWVVSVPIIRPAGTG